MKAREALVSRSIQNAIIKDTTDEKKTILGKILAFFTFFQITLSRYRDDDFTHLRDTIWEMDEDEYQESFRSQQRSGKLVAIGDLGYSGSSFFSTSNSKFLIKSLPRASEYSFFAEDMLDIYCSHMEEHPNSLLVRITDFLHGRYRTLGSILRFVSSHHVVMENLLYGKGHDQIADKWETYDLKPVTYFYPERDIAGGALTPASVKDRLIDDFNDKIRISKPQCAELIHQLSVDTKLLESTNVVDYSLFLVRFPSNLSTQDQEEREVPFLKCQTSPWRSGVFSSDGKWLYRAVILDFFWAKHKFHAKAMTALISSYNVIGRQGPMSITTDAIEYRERFLKMVEGIIEVTE